MLDTSGLRRASPGDAARVNRWGCVSLAAFLVASAIWHASHAEVVRAIAMRNIGNSDRVTLVDRLLDARPEHVDRQWLEGSVRRLGEPPSFFKRRPMQLTFAPVTDFLDIQGRTLMSVMQVQNVTEGPCDRDQDGALELAVQIYTLVPGPPVLIVLRVVDGSTELVFAARNPAAGREKYLRWWNWSGPPGGPQSLILHALTPIPSVSASPNATFVPICSFEWNPSTRILEPTADCRATLPVLAALDAPIRLESEQDLEDVLTTLFANTMSPASSPASAPSGSDRQDDK